MSQRVTPYWIGNVAFLRAGSGGMRTGPDLVRYGNSPARPPNSSAKVLMLTRPKKDYAPR